MKLDQLAKIEILKKKKTHPSYLSRVGLSLNGSFVTKTALAVRVFVYLNNGDVDFNFISKFHNGVLGLVIFVLLFSSCSFNVVLNTQAFKSFTSNSEIVF